MWAGASQWGRQLLGLATTIVLARLLEPSAFGLYSLAMVWIGLCALCVDFGLGTALIQKKSLSYEELNGVFWLGLALSVSLVAIVWYASPAVGRLSGDVRISPLLRALSLTLVGTALSSVHQALAARAIDFRKIAHIELMSTAGGSVAAVTWATITGSVWSLVLQSLVAALLSAALYWREAKWFPSVRIAKMRVGGLLPFSSNLAGFNVVNFVARNVDNLLIGRFLGAESLGYYSLAYRIMLFPLQNISSVLGRVMFAVLSSVQDDDRRVREGFNRLSKYVALVTCPLMFGVLVFVGDAVATVFGDRWAPVAALLRILALVGMAQSLGTNVGVIYMTKGRTDMMFRWGVAATAVITVSIVLGLQWGLLGVALGYLAANVVVFAPGIMLPLSLIAGRFRDFLSSVAPAFVLGSVACVIALAARTGLTAAGVPVAATLILESAFLVTAYVAMIRWKRPALVVEIREMFEDVRRGSARHG